MNTNPPTDTAALAARIAAKKAEPAFQQMAKTLSAPVPLGIVAAQVLRDAAAEVAAMDPADAALAGQYAFQNAAAQLHRRANEAEYVATPCDPMVPCEDGGEPCHVHERLMSHYDGSHELCEPNCGDADPAVSVSSLPDQTLRNRIADERSERYATTIHDAMEPDLSLVDQEPGAQALFACAAEAAMALADSEQVELRRKLAAAERIRENADFHLGQEMARRQLAEKEAARQPVDRAAVLREVFEALRTGDVRYDTAAVEAAVQSGGPRAVLAYVQATIGEHVRRLAAEAQQSECSASISGNCLRESQSETACDTDAGECVHGGRPAADDTDLTETDIDRLMAAGVPVQIVTAPPGTRGAEAPQPDTAAPAAAGLGRAADTRDDEEAQFGVPGCTCKPWTTENGKRRFMEPGETVDRISGWHVLGTCPHHGGEEAQS